MTDHMCHYANCDKYVDLNKGGVYVNYRNDERMRFCCIEHAAMIMLNMANRHEFARTITEEYERIQARKTSQLEAKVTQP